MGCNSSVSSSVQIPENTNPNNFASLPLKDTNISRRCFRSDNVGTATVRCAERWFKGQETKTHVKLVVFDLDETLTMATFMPKQKDKAVFTQKRKDQLKKYNFESPFVADGSRSEKLRSMLQNLKHGDNGEARTLAILTRNLNGIGCVLDLLRLGDLADYFSAIWVMNQPQDQTDFCGAFQTEEGWELFNPPIEEYGLTTKVDVLTNVARNPSKWFPNNCTGSKGPSLNALRPEEVVLVDDQIQSFINHEGLKALRFCKVAKYEANYHKLGYITDLGGIGAHSDADFQEIVKFVERPWMFPETLEARCFDSSVQTVPDQERASLIVFGFDETLTLATFMPSEEDFELQLGWEPPRTSTWSQKSLVSFCFETPFIGHGNRCHKLANMLEALSEQRTLVILTENNHGVIAVLNLLLMAGLAKYFSAIWRPCRSQQNDGRPDGVFQEDGHWRCFQLPLGINARRWTKAEVLRHVCENPEDYLPQLQHGNCLKLLPLHPQNIVLVDDEQSSFQDSNSGESIARFCKVAKYDAEYRDCGLMNQMGGIGAHDDVDFQELLTFVDRPWDFPKSPTHCNPLFSLPSEKAGAGNSTDVSRTCTPQSTCPTEGSF